MGSVGREFGVRALAVEGMPNTPGEYAVAPAGSPCRPLPGGAILRLPRAPGRCSGAPLRLTRRVAWNSLSERSRGPPSSHRAQVPMRRFVAEATHLATTTSRVSDRWMPNKSGVRRSESCRFRSRPRTSRRGCATPSWLTLTTATSGFPSRTGSRRTGWRPATDP